MSISSLPEWKQLLLDKKRREEEERERRGKEEEEKLASMPAWKRGIIQRRKARQESLGDREKDRDICLLQVDGRSPFDGLSDTDSSVTINLGSELSLSPDPGQWLDAEPKLASQVSAETIVPVHENPFIRTQKVWRKGRDSGEAGNDLEVKEKEKLSPRDQDVETRRGRDVEMKIERFKDLNEGWEKEKTRDRSLGRERENSREGCDKDKHQWKDSVKEQEFFKIRKDTDEKEPHPPSGPFSPLVPGLRTIRADNIIIIEQDRKGSDERKGKWREPDREKADEDQLGKRGMKMDLREILAGGGSVTEIRATEVLIIKPSANPEELSTGGKGREDGELKTSVGLRRESLGKELRTDMSWVRGKEKERPWGQATVINKDERKDSIDDNVFVDRGGRVSQLLSKFGEHPKPPSRSKSSDNFLPSGVRKYSGDQDDRQSEERKTHEKNMLLKNVPKRSYSFSDRVIGSEENGLDNRESREKVHIDGSAAPWGDVADLGRDATAKLKRNLDKDRFGKHREVRAEDERGGVTGRRNEADTWIKHRTDLKRAEPVYTKSAEKVSDRDEDKGFTVASVKNTEGISFARRVPIRQDGRARSERQMKLLTGEKSWEHVEKDSEAGGHTDVHATDTVDVQREDEFECTIQVEVSDTVPASEESLSLSPALESQHRRDFTESCGLLSVVTDRVPHRRPEWSGTGPQGPYLTHSVLSPQTEDLISKIEKLGDTTIYVTERGERANKAGHERPKESKDEVQTRMDSGSEGLIPSTVPRSPERIPAIGTLPAPLDIQIPRTVFYVAEDMLDRKKAEGQSSDGQDWDGGQGVQRRDSWRIGKPLSRIESLREKIRQRELAKQKQREVQDGDEGEAVDVCNRRALDDRYDERESGREQEWESLACMEKRLTEAERVQEEAARQTSITASDVTREVTVLKTFPQLPVSVPHLQAESGEEVTNEYATVASEIISACFQTAENEDDSRKHVEDHLRLQPESREEEEDEVEEEEEEEEQNEFFEEEEEEEEEEEFASSFNSSHCLSPSLPHPNSLAAMSRIYNLDTVGSRSGLCLKNRTVGISSSVNLVKVKPLISNLQQGDSKAPNVDDVCGVQTIKQQIEQLQLKEQEVLNSSASSNAVLRDRDTKGHQSPKGVSKQKLKDDEETQETNPKLSPQRICPPASQLKQTITITPSFLRSQSPDNSLKPTNCAPTPASSPCSPSPTQSPSVSPSPNPSPTLFTIKSASGGRGKRGATITITPKKPKAAGSTVPPSTAGSTKAPPQQGTPAVAGPVKKKYPTAEEIEVIGGYQNLERSCLVKIRGNPKRGKVCFDEGRLEQVCEYPSETSMLALSPLPPDLLMEKLQGEEAQEEEGDEGGPVLFKRSTGIPTGPRLRVDESCPR